jgi:hypothetical protein
MTTGDVEAFSGVAERVFGAELPAVEEVTVEVGSGVAADRESSTEAASVRRG